MPETIRTINQLLQDFYGVDTVTGKTMWRVVWSDDQYEKRLTDRTDSGICLLFPEVRELPKYQWIKHRYVLERLVLIPEVNLVELPSEKLSYEPIWVFEDRHKNALPPAFWACKFCIDTVMAAQGHKSMAKYVDDEAKNPIEHRENRIKALEEELFGDESNLMLRTVTGEASIVPRNYEKSMQGESK